MSKFGNLISQAKGELPETKKAAEKISSEQRASQQEKPARLTKHKTLEPEKQVAIYEESVNLSIKVPKSLRMHWVAEAKRTGTSITAEIIEAMSKKFGIPR